MTSTGPQTTAQPQASTSTVSVGSTGLSRTDVTLTRRGHGRPFLFLHGGGGPQTVTGFADLLSEAKGAEVIVHVHPGFGGTPRPEDLSTVRQLAALYVGLLDELDLSDVTVVGNSIGGWVAAEMAILGSPRVSGIVIVNGVGIQVPGHPIADFFSLTMAEVAQLSYHDPDKFGINVDALPPAAKAAMAANRATLAIYSGTSMGDPTLAGRLGAVTVPTLVLWGEADRIADPDFGRAYAAAIPGSEFRLLAATGHLPQLETPGQLLDQVWGFAGGPHHR